ncbi:PHP domain-containing protein [Aestuariibacter halophilus]|uniref:PHP domain-containing protein n=1 Tax=Fluctibacter halophilus TaxID=226011 RepID=A0ABS8G409_9ALTE|nr:PHP domain-containing protein [Aestuariibacter halophilus]MCC2615265.1 PHP domain-containing protein [Aestuariibacter halophilus]
MKIDLHSHTRCSDGTLTPAELVQRAHTMQVDVLAITDHDTVAGIESAMAAQAQTKRPLRIVPGVELSTSWHGFDIHVLGLEVAHNDDRFLQRLETQSQRRQTRAQKMADKLAKAGIEGVYEAARQLAGDGQITRAHFARALVSMGAVKDMDSAFKKYLGKGKRAHVKPEWITIEQATTWIHEAGGQAVLAHPGHYDMTTKWLRRLVAEFAEAGGDGMEVVHSHLSPAKQQLLIDMALEHGLKGSAGSDFHFPNRWTELGRNLSISDSLTPIWQAWPWGQALQQLMAGNTQ